MSSFCCDPSRYLQHRTPMLLIDRVLAADAETTRCRVTVGEQCSLFRQADGSYPNSLFIEFMAQTVGVFAGIRDSESGIGPRVGFCWARAKCNCTKKRLPKATSLTLIRAASFSDKKNFQANSSAACSKTTPKWPAPSSRFTALATFKNSFEQTLHNNDFFNQPYRSCYRRLPRHRPRHCSAIGPRRLLCCRARVQTVGRT